MSKLFKFVIYIRSLSDFRCRLFDGFVNNFSIMKSDYCLFHKLYTKVFHFFLNRLNTENVILGFSVFQRPPIYPSFPVSILACFYHFLFDLRF